MQEHTRTPVFQEKNGTWRHLTKTVNSLICTIEYGSSAGFSSKEDALESYQQSMDAYQDQISRLKKSRNMPFTFSEYLNYWLRDVYTPIFNSSSAQLRNRWVIELIILPHLHKDILLDCISTGYINKVLGDCQKVCTNGGYYAYRLLHTALRFAYYNSYIPDNNFQEIRHYPEPVRNVTFYSNEQLRRFLDVASHSSSYLEIQLALFCGLKKGEILGLRYSDFHKKECTVKIQRIYTIQRNTEDGYQFKKLSGTRQNRTLKIPSFIFQELAIRRKKNLSILEKYPSETKYKSSICLGPAAKTKSDNTLGVSLKQIAIEAGLPVVCMGDLRYMFARFLMEQGFSLETISAILGHTKLNTTLAFCSIFPCEEPEIGIVIGNTLDPVFESGTER